MNKYIVTLSKEERETLSALASGIGFGFSNLHYYGSMTGLPFVYIALFLSLITFE